MRFIRDSYFLALLREHAAGEKNRLAAACLASGVMQGLAVFTVLQGLRQLFDDGLRFHTFLAFLVCLASFHYLFRYISRRSAQIALRGIMEWRLRIAGKLRGLSLAEQSNLDYNRVQSALLDGRDMVVEAARMLMAAGANSIMILLAFARMFAVSLPGAIGVIVLMSSGLYIFLRIIRGVGATMGPAMLAERRFGADLADLHAGLQQLKIHYPKTSDLFGKHILPDLEKASAARNATERGHAVGISFFAMFNLLVLGLVLFLMPGLVDIEPQDVSTLLVLCMFSLTPLISLVSFVPMLGKVEASLRETADIEKEIDAVVEPFEKADIAAHWQGDKPRPPEFSSISLRNVRFNYRDREGKLQAGVHIRHFTLNRGEMVFIRGGNGAGKSTFMKVLAGLYPPREGEILLNGRRVLPSDLRGYRNLFSLVPTDYHLFPRPLGLTAGPREFEEVFALTGIGSEVSVLDDGTFSKTTLSAGQRKRLALACALLEKREVYLLDEVAADFDPDFRRQFYEKLLPGIVGKGGTVLAISHDDRYFGVADRVLAMEEHMFVDETESADHASDARRDGGCR